MLTVKGSGGRIDLPLLPPPDLRPSSKLIVPVSDRTNFDLTHRRQGHIP